LAARKVKRGFMHTTCRFCSIPPPPHPSLLPCSRSFSSFADVLLGVIGRGWLSATVPLKKDAWPREPDSAPAQWTSSGCCWTLGHTAPSRSSRKLPCGRHTGEGLWGNTGLPCRARALFSPGLALGLLCSVSKAPSFLREAQFSKQSLHKKKLFLLRPSRSLGSLMANFRACLPGPLVRTPAHLTTQVWSAPGSVLETLGRAFSLLSLWSGTPALACL
jgi:hypothetical protein